MTAAPVHFTTIGGELCLIFTNTVNRESPELVRRLGTYTDLVLWARQFQILTKAEAEGFLSESKRQAKQAMHVLESAWQLQDLIYRIFSNWVDQKGPQTRDLETLNQALSEVLARQRIALKKGEIYWTWDDQEMRLDRLLWPVLHSAADLLTSERLQRVKRCEGCGWLFIDNNNGTRRWCTMRVCGNRAKARRHYARTR